MTESQIRKTIYDAFYRVIEIGKQPTLDVFLTKTLQQTLPKNQPVPGSWPDFWWQAIVMEIQKGFLKSDEYWDELSVDYLKGMYEKTWEEVCVDADNQADSLEEI